MNRDQISGNWKQFKGKGKKKRRDAIDDDLDCMAGKKVQLVDKVQKKYGLAKKEAEEQIKEFEEAMRY